MVKSSNLPRDQHRLFVACPIPLSTAIELGDWAAEALLDMPVRLVRPEQMHVTLMFFPSVSSKKRDELVDLIRQVEWVPIHTKTVRLLTLRRNAVAIDLSVPTAKLERFEDRLGRASIIGDDKFAERLYLSKQPLAQLAFSQDRPELDKLCRRDRARRPLQLHVTMGRANKSWKLSQHQLKTPSIRVVLDRIALYESELRHEGAIYHEIGTPV